MGIDEMRLLVIEAVYWLKMNTDIENTVCQMPRLSTDLAEEKVLIYEIPCRLWEVQGADVFMVNNKMLLHIVDYYSMFPTVKNVGILEADDLVQTAKLIFYGNGFPKKVISVAGTDLMSETVREYCRQMSIQQSITSPYHHQSNDQVEMFIKFIKHN